MFCWISTGSCSRLTGSLRSRRRPNCVELLQVGVGERDDLREKRVEPHVVAEVAAELALVLGRRGLVAIDDRSEGRVQRSWVALGSK